MVSLCLILTEMRLQQQKRKINLENLSETAIESNEDSFFEDLPTSSLTSTTSKDTTCTKSQSTKLLKRNSEVALTKDVLLTVQNHFKCPASQNDRYDIFGKGITLILRDLDKTQALFAEKIINKALFLGEMGNLTISHKVMTPTTTPFDEVCSRSSTPLSSSSTSNYSNTSQNSTNYSLPLHRIYSSTVAGYNESSIIQSVYLSCPTTMYQIINQLQDTQEGVLLPQPNSGAY
ncbi:hypothetical protein QTP88_011687 [Uroleucon formosanum]